jgi:hydrogenase expression/formation protein HypC
MCLSIPAEIIKIENDRASVSIGGNIYSANISLLENIQPGDFILLHAGFGIQKFSDEDAKQTLRLLGEMGDSRGYQ